MQGSEVLTYNICRAFCHTEEAQQQEGQIPRDSTSEKFLQQANSRREKINGSYWNGRRGKTGWGYGIEQVRDLFEAMKTFGNVGSGMVAQYSGR